MDTSSALFSQTSPTKSTTSGAYVISLANLDKNLFAATDSAPSNKISIYDKQTLKRLLLLAGHEIATTSLQSAPSIAGSSSQVLLSSGKDGSIKIWDGRSNSPTLAFSNDRGILSCDVSADGFMIAAGTELVGDDAMLLYWDPRQPSVPLRTHSSTHSDDITAVKFAPGSDPKVVLSASADGLLCTSNADENDEDESVLQVGNWGCSISQIGWMLPPAQDPRIWASSDMETFSTWSDQLDQRLSIDIRAPSVHTQQETWVTDYLVSCVSTSRGLDVFVGSNEGDVALITHPNVANSSSRWALQRLWSHGHEGVVRSLLLDEENAIVITGGEDTKINVWPSGGPVEHLSNEDMDVDMS